MISLSSGKLEAVLLISCNFLGGTKKACKTLLFAGICVRCKKGYVNSELPYPLVRVLCSTNKLNTQLFLDLESKRHRMK